MAIGGLAALGGASDGTRPEAPPPPLLWLRARAFLVHAPLRLLGDDDDDEDLDVEREDALPSSVLLPPPLPPRLLRDSLPLGLGRARGA